MKKKFMKIISLVLVFVIVFSFFISPLDRDYKAYAATVAMSFETLAYISAFLLVACGMIYDDIDQFNSDVMSLTEHLHQYALRESEWYPGKTQAFEWKVIINENYKQEPDPEKPNDPKKYYIPIHVSLFETAKAWVIAHLMSHYNDGVSQPDSELIPIQDFDNVELSVYDYDFAEPCITFYTPDGHLIGRYNEDDYTTWPLALMYYEEGIYG